MIRAGERYINKENETFLVFGLAEHERTGECLVICKNKVTRKFYVKSIDDFEKNFELGEVE